MYNNQPQITFTNTRIHKRMLKKCLLHSSL